MTLSPPNSVVARSRQDVLATTLGWGGYPYNPSMANAISPTAGDFRGIAIQLYAGDTITGLGFGCTTVATTPTLVRLAVYSASYALLGSTANDTTLMSSTGMKTKALSAPIQVATDRIVFVGLLVVGAAFGSILGLGGSAVAHVGRTGSPRSAVYQAGLADLPDPLVPVVPGTNNAMPWLAWF